jgi:deoxyribose-phosphate aldolase
VISDDEKNLARVIDYTCLDATATKEKIVQVCKEAKTYGFHTVCVNGRWLPLAAGAQRIGTSSGVQIIEEFKHRTMGT